MSSVSSRSEYPNRVFSSSPSDDTFVDDHEPLEPHRTQRPRHHSSYEEMNGYTTEGHLHQYEDPRGLVDQVKKMNRNYPPPSGGEERARPRKKMNDLYERCRTESEVYGSDHSNKNGRKCGALCFFVLVAMILSLGALALSMLIFTGIAIPSGCRSCGKQELNHEPGTSKSASSAHLMRLIKELEGNVTVLRKLAKAKDAAIHDLLSNDEEQNEKLLHLSRLPTYVIIKNAKYNVSNLAGPRGPRGYNGSRGLPGPPGKPSKPATTGANFSSCVYGTKSTAFTPSPISGHDVSVREPNGWIIMSATCATVGAAHSNLRRLRSGSVVQYNCQCRGKDEYSTTAKCIIHYWKCPV